MAEMTWDSGESTKGRELALTVIMPAHNEERTVAAAVQDILGLEMRHRMELVVLDDGSTDGTALQLSRFADHRLMVLRHTTNLGKGAAILSGAAVATGSHMVVFDADREYYAGDLPRMFEPIADGKTDVVYGTRLLGINTVYYSYRYALGNRVTTLAANLLYDACLTDLHTCLKMMPVSLFRQLQLTETGFGLDSEITAEILRRGYRPFEIPVTYVGRSHAQGKKLTWRDGVRCLKVLGMVRLRGTVTRTVIDLTDQPGETPPDVLAAPLPTLISLTGDRAPQTGSHASSGSEVRRTVGFAQSLDPSS